MYCMDRWAKTASPTHIPYNVTMQSVMTGSREAGSRPESASGGASSLQSQTTRSQGMPRPARAARPASGSSAKAVLGASTPAAVERDGTRAAVKSLTRPSSASNLRFHSATEWANALTSSPASNNISPASLAAGRTVAYAPERGPAPVLIPPSASLRPKRMDGTAAATKLIASIQNRDQVADWFIGSVDSGLPADSMAMEPVAVPEPSPARASTARRPLSASTHGKTSGRRPTSAALVHSPRQQSYLDGIIVRLGAPLPRACMLAVCRVTVASECLMWHFISSRHDCI